MYKEYREMSRTDAVEAMYQDMAARHRARFRSIHVRIIRLSNKNRSRSIPSLGLDEANKEIRIDPPCRRAREVRRCQAPLHQAAPHQEPGLPSAPPCSQDQFQEGLLRYPAIHFRLSISLLWRWCLIWFSALVWRGVVGRSADTALLTNHKRENEGLPIRTQQKWFPHGVYFRDQTAISLTIFALKR